MTLLTRLKTAWFKWLRTGRRADTLTASDFLVPDGSLVTIYGCDGTAKSMVRTVGHNGSVITIRPLRWYERLRIWLRFEPHRNYSHPQGVLEVSQVFSVDRYYDEVIVVPNTRAGRLIHKFYSFLYRHRDWIMRYDAESLDIKDGECFPKYSGSYWWFQPFRFANRFFPRVDGQQMREWPEIIK